MEINPEDAQEALAAIEQTVAKTRRMIAFNAYFQIVWGLFFFSGFLANQFVHSAALTWIWLALLAVAFTLATGLGVYQGRRLHIAWSPRAGGFSVALACYCVLWLILAQRHETAWVALFMASVVAFGYVVTGIWQGNVVRIIGAAAATLLLVLGYYLLFDYFWLEMALLCGGMLVGGGIYQLLRRR